LGEFTLPPGRVSQRQFQLKRATFAGRRIDPKFSLQKVGQPPGDRGSQPDAFFSSGAGRMKSVNFAENPIHALLRNPLTIGRDPESDSRVPVDHHIRD